MRALLEVRDLSKSFDGLPVAAGISLDLAAGDRTALIGPNGAGKTSVVNLIGGQVRADAGTIRLAGADITRASPTARARLGLVRSFQVTRLFAAMTPEEHVALALLQRAGHAGRLCGSYRRMPGVLAEVRDILGLLALDGVAQKPAGTIAYGQQRLLEIALVLALRPKVLLLDEPAAGVPPADAVLIERALARLPADLAVLLIEHDMDFVFRFARRADRHGERRGDLRGHAGGAARRRWGRLSGGGLACRRRRQDRRPQRRPWPDAHHRRGEPCRARRPASRRARPNGVGSRRCSRPLPARRGAMAARSGWAARTSPGLAAPSGRAPGSAMCRRGAPSSAR